MPANYRATSFLLDSKQKCLVASLASPEKDGQLPETVLRYLKDRNIDTIFALAPSAEAALIAAKCAIQYVSVPVQDCEAPDLVLYEMIYEKIIQQAALGKGVAIHCDEGNGRSGCILAGLKLKELASEVTFHQGDISVSKTIDGVPCSEMVERAILSIRLVNKLAVESLNQIRSLGLYEKKLRQCLPLLELKP